MPLYKDGSERFIVQSHVTMQQGANNTANEGPARIQYKCLVPIYVFPEIKLLFRKQNYNVLSLNSYTHTSVRDLHIYIARIGLSILRQKYVDRSWEHINHSQTHECGNWAEAAQFPEKEYINGIFFAVSYRKKHLTQSPSRGREPAQSLAPPTWRSTAVARVSTMLLQISEPPTLQQNM